MTQENPPPATGGWRDALHPMPKPTTAHPEGGADVYYILYYAEQTPTGVMGPLRRARYASAHEAADRAMEMLRAGLQRPVEIRDRQDRLITCEMMGWQLPPLARGGDFETAGAARRFA
ncbi:hypothetical protein [Ancylobacter amanitiformis]|uniref:Uncharacterized protein n=1 Tax=Ancylobacter amanitiformis TaxID=217069 RepID=A0ABU0LU32_9HYPH|nr:hypothetical protein [Ancylobacter amanitiformis]MDQ0512216.1 hypothetical protein [Ancylobacter amanitiformis]